MNFDTEKLQTTFIPPATPTLPVNERKYTLTHSDTTGDLFLDIGCEFNYDAINKELRDELLGRWSLSEDCFYNLFFYAYVYVDDFKKATKKYDTFKFHMELALQSVIYGDKLLFERYPYLLDTPIYVKFDSKFPIYDNYEYYGCVRDYVL